MEVKLLVVEEWMVVETMEGNPTVLAVEVELSVVQTPSLANPVELGALVKGAVVFRPSVTEEMDVKPSEGEGVEIGFSVIKAVEAGPSKFGVV